MSGAHVTINSGKFEGASTGVFFSSGTLTINAGEFTGESYGLYSDVSTYSDSNEIIINDGIFDGNDVGVLLFGLSKATINDETITGSHSGLEIFCEKATKNECNKIISIKGGIYKTTRKADNSTEEIDRPYAIGVFYNNDDPYKVSDFIAEGYELSSTNFKDFHYVDETENFYENYLLDVEANVHKLGVNTPSLSNEEKVENPNTGIYFGSGILVFLIMAGGISFYAMRKKNKFPQA